VSSAKGQLVRLTMRDYRLLREALEMADHWRGGKMPEEWPEFDQASNQRWQALDKIRVAVQPRKVAALAALLAICANSVPV
jgi:hypothetical protein